MTLPDELREKMLEAECAALREMLEEAWRRILNSPDDTVLAGEIQKTLERDFGTRLLARLRTYRRVTKAVQAMWRGTYIEVDFETMKELKAALEVAAALKE